MKRRDFIKGAGIAAGAGVAAAATGNLAAPAVAQERIPMVIVSTWPRDFPGLGTGAQRFAQRVADLSDGRIQVEYYAAGERVGAFDAFDEVSPRATRRPITARTTTGRASTRRGPTSPRCRSA